jgi:hypothetical protein
MFHQRVWRKGLCRLTQEEVEKIREIENDYIEEANEALALSRPVIALQQAAATYDERIRKVFE